MIGNGRGDVGLYADYCYGIRTTVWTAGDPRHAFSAQRDRDVYICARTVSDVVSRNLWDEYNVLALFSLRYDYDVA